jgi:hypothetical protein
MAKYICYGDRSANDFKHEERDRVCKYAAENGPEYWANHAKNNLVWTKEFEEIIDTSD